LSRCVSVGSSRAFGAVFGVIVIVSTSLAVLVGEESEVLGLSGILRHIGKNVRFDSSTQVKEVFDTGVNAVKNGFGVGLVEDKEDRENNKEGLGIHKARLDYLKFNN